jgi:hypothetical protein
MRRTGAALGTGVLGTAALGTAALVLAGCGTTSTARTELIRQQDPDGTVVSDPPCAGPVTVVVLPGQATRVALVCFVP